MTDDVALELTHAAQEIAKETEAQGLRVLACVIVATATKRLMYDNVENGRTIPRSYTLVHTVNMGLESEPVSLARRVLECGINRLNYPEDDDE
jgi:hypothetical protein